MANTGKKIVLSIKEINTITGLPTGQTKSNDMGDPDYIAPYDDTATCPLVTGFSCPTGLLTGSVGKIYFDFSIPAAVIATSGLASIKLSSVNSSNVVTNSISYPQPINSFFSNFITTAAGSGYKIRLEYLDSSDGVLFTCNSIGPTVNVS